MSKYFKFSSQTPQVRPKPAIYTPKRDDERLRHFGIPPPRLLASLVIHCALSAAGPNILNVNERTTVRHCDPHENRQTKSGI